MDEVSLDIIRKEYVAKFQTAYSNYTHLSAQLADATYIDDLGILRGRLDLIEELHKASGIMVEASNDLRDFDRLIGFKGVRYDE